MMKIKFKSGNLRINFSLVIILSIQLTVVIWHGRKKRLIKVSKRCFLGSMQLGFSIICKYIEAAILTQF